MNTLKNVLTISFVILFCFYAFRLFTNIVVAPIGVEAHELSYDNVQIERDDIDRLIDQLSWCESRNDEKAINPHDPDTASYGLLQFKEATFFSYNRVYKILPDLESAEVLNVIFEGEVQRKLAKKIIENGGWKNWYNCLKRYFI